MNLKLPAFPLSIAQHSNGTLMTTFDVSGADAGFTKLEYAALMIAAGIASDFTPNQDKYLVERSVEIAKAIIEECNK